MPLIPSHPSRHAAPLAPASGAVHVGSAFHQPKPPVMECGPDVSADETELTYWGPIRPDAIYCAALRSFTFTVTEEMSRSQNHLINELFKWFPLHECGWRITRTAIRKLSGGRYQAMRV